MKSILRFLLNEDGPTAVEYAVMLALIILTALAAVVSFGQASSDMWSNVNSQMDSHM